MRSGFWLGSCLWSCLWIAAGGPAVASSAQLDRGDAQWAARASELDGDLAVFATIEGAVASYRDAVADDPTSLEGRWKLLRSLHFLSEFSNAEESAKSRAVDEMIRVATQSIALASTAQGTVRDRARNYFWSAIAWGARAQRVGSFAIVREGIAGRMREYAEQSIVLDPSVDHGGAFRLLSRLHASLPRIPFVSGWVDREAVLSLAEQALAIDPDHPGNRMILALALLERVPRRRGEAIDLLACITREEPNPDFLVEELAIQARALERLTQLERETE